MSLENILQVLEDESTFGFGEIRLSTSFKELFKKNEKLYNTINLFSFGSYTDYIGKKEKYIELTEGAIFKLRQLTLMSEALDDNTLSYDLLQDKLILGNDQELERLIVESIYSDIIEAKIYSQERYIKISTCRGRDVLLSSEEIPDYDKIMTIEDLLAGLEKFNRRIDKAFEYTEQISNHLRSGEDELLNDQPSINSSQELESIQDSINSDGILPDGRRHSVVSDHVVPSQASISLPEVAEVNIASYNGRKRKTQD